MNAMADKQAEDTVAFRLESEDATTMLSSHLMHALPSDNPFDSPNFDPIEYINARFPDEKSLNKAEEFIAKLQDDINYLESDIVDTVIIQATQGQKSRVDLNHVQESIDMLFKRMASMKIKAAESEKLVQEICKDVKSLNNAKINLTATITALKRIVMFVSALEQLGEFAAKRKYKEAAELISATRELSQHFEGLMDIPKINELLKEKDRLFANLKQQIQEDFNSIFDSNEETVENLFDACTTVDAISPKFRREIITQFVLKLLEVYKKLFASGTEASGLESVKRRYMWLKRSQADFDSKYSKYFLSSWNVPCYFAEHFCHITRQQLVEILSSSAHVVGPKVLVQTLSQSIEFEKSLSSRFNFKEMVNYADEPPIIGAADVKDGAIQEQPIREYIPKFKGIISECFEVYLGSWVRSEEQSLMDLLNSITADDQPIGNTTTSPSLTTDGHERKDDEVPSFIYNSALELFGAIKKCVHHTTIISSKQTLFEIFQVFKRIIKRYIEILSGRFKKGTLPMKEANAKAICCVLGTAEYCDVTLPMLSSTISREIDTSYKDTIGFDTETELLWSLKANAVQYIVTGIEAALEPFWQKMIKTNWTTIQALRENSVFVFEINGVLTTVAPWFSSYLSTSYYRFLCDKIAQYIVPKLIASIYACKRIGDIGAQQLINDTNNLKNLLLELPVISHPERNVSPAYKKFVSREIGNALALLMALTIPDLNASSYKTLLEEQGASGTVEDLPKILALKSSSEGPLSDVSVLGISPMSGMISGARELRGGFQGIGDAFKKEGTKAAEDMRYFLNIFSKSKQSTAATSNTSDISNS